MLVALVSSRMDEQKEAVQLDLMQWASGALSNLTANNAENQVMIQEAGSTMLLVALISSRTEGQKEQGSRALSNLAVNNTENQVSI